MIRKHSRRATIALVCGAFTATGLVGLAGPSSATPGVPVPAISAGHLVTWGASGPGNAIPASLSDTPVVAVDSSPISNYNLAVRTDGTVAAWGDPNAAPMVLPSGLDDVTAVSAGGSYALALKADGTVTAWGSAAAGTTTVPADLTGVTSVLANQLAAVAVHGGEVTEWGTSASFVEPPAGLSDVTQVAAGTMHFLALKSDGTVVSWGFDSNGDNTVPTDIQGHVIQVAAGGNTSAALLDDGTVRVWGDLGSATQPAGLSGEKVTEIAVNGSIVARTASGKVFAWGGTAVDTVPALDGYPVAISSGYSDYAVAITTKLAAATAPAIHGTSQVGQALSFTPAQFTLTPDKVTSQWLADGTPITDATGDQLTLTNDLVGKTITVAQTATLGSDSVTATSPATVSVKNASTTKVTVSPAVSTWGRTHKVTATVTANGAPATGKVTIKAGATTTTATLNSSGTATATLPSRLRVGRYTVSAAYSGSATATASTGRATLSITKASVKLSEKFPAVIKRNKRVTAAVTAKIIGSSLTATGTVKIYKGKRVVGTAKLVHGVAKVKLAKLHKGKQHLTIKLAGNTNVKAAVKHFTIRVK